METRNLVVRGARVHNLRNVTVEIPKGRLVVFTGVSGSGKSSLAFDTIYAEGQRRYIESLSTYARQFLGEVRKPDVDLITGLAPTISIEQKAAGRNPRSTVGTMTEIYDYLRVLYARVGVPHCTRCGREIGAQSREEILQRVLAVGPGKRVLILAPIARGRKGEFKDTFADALRMGFLRARVDGAIVRLTEEVRLARNVRHDVDIVVDRFVVGQVPRHRVAEAVETALAAGEGRLVVAVEEEGGGAEEVILSSRLACAHCGVSFEELGPASFSFNSALGMCRACSGLGTRIDVDPALLVPDESLSINQGALRIFGVPNKWLLHLLDGVGRYMGFDLDTPWRQLTGEQREAILYGLGNRRLTFWFPVRDGEYFWEHKGTWEGLVTYIKRKHSQMRSERGRRRYESCMRAVPCEACGGARLRPEALAVTVGGKNIAELCAMTVAQAHEFLESLRLPPEKAKIASQVLREVRERLRFLLNVGLHYITLDRSAPTLSGGEAQRIRLASQIGCGLVGVVYVLDEPSIGLHQRDNRRLLDALERLRDMGNTVIVVEHDEETIRSADYVVDFGPGPGASGGRVVVAGTPGRIARTPDSITGRYLARKLRIEVPRTRRRPDGRWLTVHGARHHNLKNIDVRFPIGLFTCVTGVSGSGKSSLVADVLYEALARELSGAQTHPGEHDRISGVEHLDKVVNIDQSPIGRTPRSNPATYVKVFDAIRALYARLPAARAQGYKPGRFSFNVPGGRCEACQGNGAVRLEMDFLADVWVTCSVCEGKRFNRETLSVTFKGRSISDVLEMSVDEAARLFADIPPIASKLATLQDVGLGYIKLGQSATTLSGGEAQRVKLARELSRPSTGRTLYILDEPTTGLHFADVSKLLDVLHRLTDAGNTVIVIEHNLEVVKTADYIIDLGPEGGEEGGEVVAWGSPEEVASAFDTPTARCLRRVLGGGDGRRTGARPRRGGGTGVITHIAVRGASQHNLKGISARIPRERMTVFCGPSGSGKSSLALDTIYAEGQRRYVESLSPYARQFISRVGKPEVDHIEGLSPAIAIDQKTAGQNPRSTVGTITEIYDYMRVLWARLGKPYCPECGGPVGAQSLDEMVDRVLAACSGQTVLITAPVEPEPGQTYADLLAWARRLGFVRVWVDGGIYRVDEAPAVQKKRRHDFRIVADRPSVSARSRSRVASSLETALSVSGGVVRVVREGGSELVLSQRFSCARCGAAYEELTPQHFSFNSPLGMCPACEGLGVQEGIDVEALIGDARAPLAGGGLAGVPASPLLEEMLGEVLVSLGADPKAGWADLSESQRRDLLRGTGERWYTTRSGLAFQYAGLYAAVALAGKHLPSFRRRLGGRLEEMPCSACGGARIRPEAAAVRLGGLRIHEATALTTKEALEFFEGLPMDERERAIAGEVLNEITSRLRFLLDVGLDYLSLDRRAPTLAGGEAQRIRLASQLGSGLTGVLYVLDEPTIGLHPRDNEMLIGALKRLRDLGNTLIVVEHDREVIGASDWALDFGPGAGRSGGRIIAQGPPARLARSRASRTGPFLSGRELIPVPERRRAPGERRLVFRGCSENNLQGIDVEIPLGLFVCVTGVSGSGKSTLVNDIIYRHLAAVLHGASAAPGRFASCEGLEHVDKVINIDQTPIGHSPRSDAATYVGAFDEIRALFASVPEARARGYRPRRFSFNVPGGRCDACEGMGYKRVPMHFLPDIWVRCETCGGKRYTPETLSIRYKGKTIADVLDMTVDEALAHFADIPRLARKLRTLADVGLGYLPLGQSATTLSGGEAQRVKLAAELSRPGNRRTLYILDEPTTGLHFVDIAKLLDVLGRLVDRGSTVLVIEHNLDVVKCADWVIDLGPGGGDAGGRIVARGTPEDIAATPGSYTGQALRKVLGGGG